MHRREIYGVLARLARQKLTERRAQLQAEIDEIDRVAVLPAEEVVRQGTSREVPIAIGRARVWATEEQPDAFMLQIGSWERRCRPDDLLALVAGL